MGQRAASGRDGVTCGMTKKRRANPATLIGGREHANGAITHNFCRPVSSLRVQAFSFSSRSEFQAAMRATFISTTVTWMSGALSAITAIVGPPTKPAPMQQIFMRVGYKWAYRPANPRRIFAGPAGGHACYVSIQNTFGIRHFVGQRACSRSDKPREQARCLRQTKPSLNRPTGRRSGAASGSARNGKPFRYGTAQGEPSSAQASVGAGA